MRRANGCIVRGEVLAGAADSQVGLEELGSEELSLRPLKLSAKPSILCLRCRGEFNHTSQSFLGVNRHLDLHG